MEEAKARLARIEHRDDHAAQAIERRFPSGVGEGSRAQEGTATEDCRTRLHEESVSPVRAATPGWARMAP